MTREEAIEIVKTQYSHDTVMKTALGMLIPELREKPLTPFQQCLNCILRGVYYAEVPDKKVNEFIVNVVRTRTDELIKLAKKQEHTDCQLNKSKDEEIRQQLLWLCDEWEHNPERRTIPADISNIKQIRRYLEKQKESLHVQEICKENADSFTSEDERIRKEVIDFLETIPASELKRIPRPISEWFAWLEKQNECHIPWYDYQKSKEAGYTIVPNEEYEQLIKQKEQNPTWSEEDEKMRNLAIEWAETMYGQFRFVDMGSTDFRKIVTWLKSISQQPKPEWSEEDKKVYSRLLNHYESLTHCVTTADRHKEIREELNFLKSLHPQPKQEWSEEDEDMLNSCISSIEEAKENRYAYKETDGDTSYDHEIAWLKSLRPSWKPSEDQMDALKELIDDAKRAGWVTPGATELYEQLKKL